MPTVPDLSRLTRRIDRLLGRVVQSARSAAAPASKAATVGKPAGSATRPNANRDTQRSASWPRQTTTRSTRPPGTQTATRPAGTQPATATPKSRRTVAGRFDDGTAYETAAIDPAAVRS